VLGDNFIKFLKSWSIAKKNLEFNQLPKIGHFSKKTNWLKYIPSFKPVY